MTWPGEDAAWSRLETMNPDIVRRNIGSAPGSSGRTFDVSLFGRRYVVLTDGRQIRSGSVDALSMMDRYDRVVRLILLNYLVHARNLGATGEWIQPSDLPGGGLFQRGSHVLPLAELARLFNGDPERLAGRALMLGGRTASYDDVSYRFDPLHGLALLLILRRGDDEFPASASLLIDSAVRFLIPVDITWAVARLAVALLLDDGGEATW